MSPRTATALACQRDPELWFRAASRRYALAFCLQCPRRSQCAAEALSTRASYGMWAGIWIENNLTAVTHYLRSIAEQAVVRAPAADPPLKPVAPRVHTQQNVGAPDQSRPSAVKAVVMARSCGHCEVMTPQCRYTSDTLGSRIPHQRDDEVTDASAAYAACRPCRKLLTITDAKLVRRLGFLVDPPRRPGFVPVYWRQSRWVYFDGSPTIQDSQPTDPGCNRTELAAAIEALAQTG